MELTATITIVVKNDGLTQDSAEAIPAIVNERLEDALAGLPWVVDYAITVVT